MLSNNSSFIINKDMERYTKMFPSSPVLPYSYGCNSPSLPNDSLLLLPPSCFLSPIGSFEYQQSTVLTNESSCCSSEMTRTMVPPISYHSNSSVTITHSYHPFFYPSEEEMRQLCEESGLTTLIERKCAEISAYDWSPSKRSPKCDSVNRPTKSDSANRTAKPWKELEDTAELQIRRLAKDIARLRLDEKMERMDLQDELATQPEYKAFTPHQASTPLFTEKPLKRISTNGSIGKSMKRKLEVSMLGNKENRQQPREKKSRKINRKLSESKISHCVYCKDNGEPPLIYNHHTIKDFKGRTLCPVLRQIECPICFADGDDAHTIQDCPRRQQRLMDGARSRNVPRSLNFIKM